MIAPTYYKTKKIKNKKNLYNRLVTGLKVGWNAPVLPSKVLSFHNNPLLRVFRVIGGVSILTVFSKKHLLLSLPFKSVILFFALLHIIYISSISIIKLWYGYKVLKSDKLNVRNSPLDQFATTAGKLLYCWKYGCQVGSAGLGLVGTSFLIDSMLEAGGREKVFTPLIGKGVKLFINNRPAHDVLLGIKKDIKNLEDSKASYKEITDLFNKADKVLDSKDFSKQEINSIKCSINEIKDMEKAKLSDYTEELSKKIKQYSENNKK